MNTYNTHTQERQTALINASGEGHLEIVRLLLERGANVKAVMHVRRVLNCVLCIV